MTTALQRLLTWLSPAFPVGSFAWSGGLETAIADRVVTDSTSLQNWIEGNLAAGGLRTDAIILAHAHAAADDGPRLVELAELCLALAPARERRLEMVLTGDNFALAARAWPLPEDMALPDPSPYPVAVAVQSAAYDIALADTLVAYLTAAVHAQISVAVRLVPLGQSAGLAVLSKLEPGIADLAAFAARASLAELGAIAYAADIAQMRHESLEPRIFRS